MTVGRFARQTYAYGLEKANLQTDPAGLVGRKRDDWLVSALEQVPLSQPLSLTTTGYYDMIRSLLFLSLLLTGLSTVAQQMVPPGDYAVYEAGLPPRFRSDTKPFFLFSKTVPINWGRTHKIWYQPDVPREQLRNLRPGKDSLWIWEDTLRTPAWRQLLLRHNSLDMADSLLFDKNLFTRQKAFYWPSDAVAMNQKAIDSIGGNDPREVARKRELLRLQQEFSPSYHYLSRISYSPDGQRAMFYHGYICGSRCGSGDLIFLEKINNEWRQYFVRNVWVS